MTVHICDVAPRDGLQSEARMLAPAVRGELVRRLQESRVSSIEVGSFVRPGRVPQMEGVEDVIDSISFESQTSLTALVLNVQGYRRLTQTPLRFLRFAFAASETFNRRNSNTSAEESLQQFREVAALSQDQIACTAVIGTAFGCPFEGRVEPGRVEELAASLESAGATEIVLADTIGVATPRVVKELVRRVQHVVSVGVGVHLHDTRGQGVANAYAALEAGVRTIDASVGGIGGCPFAPDATGNVATEDIVYMLQGAGLNTDIDLDGLRTTALWLEDVLGRVVPGHVAHS